MALKPEEIVELRQILGAALDKAYVEEIEWLMGDIYTPDELAEWWRTPQILMSDRSPLEMIQTGHGLDLVQRVRQIADSVYI